LKKKKLHKETFSISKESANIINEAIKKNRNIYAVGTTTIRALESSSTKNKVIGAKNKETEIFIFPGYNFKIPYKGLITNFHLPKSSLLMLVSAFTSEEIIQNAYKIAIEKKYRFFSFGDSMLLTRKLNS
jgi:S-adenosylmethionine:tRNA ribosyltransferase-isomerase